MNKKLIIIGLILGLLGFGGSLGAGWFFKTKQNAKNQQLAAEETQEQQTDPTEAQPLVPIAGDIVKLDSELRRLAAARHLHRFVELWQVENASFDLLRCDRLVGVEC